MDESQSVMEEESGDTYLHGTHSSELAGRLQHLEAIVSFIFIEKDMTNENLEFFRQH